jgi:hypothetical protein
MPRAAVAVHRRDHVGRGGNAMSVPIPLSIRPSPSRRWRPSACPRRAGQFIGRTGGRPARPSSCRGKHLLPFPAPTKPRRHPEEECSKAQVAFKTSPNIRMRGWTAAMILPVLRSLRSFRGCSVDPAMVPSGDHGWPDQEEVAATWGEVDALSFSSPSLLYGIDTWYQWHSIVVRK